MSRYGQQRGQAMVLTVVFLTVLVGMAALVIDLGSWYNAQRETQAVADAAALAGAQELPDDPTAAHARANEYVTKNGGGNAVISFRSSGGGVDTIRVDVDRDTPGFFAKAFGVDTVDVGAGATARASGPGAARWVAPIVVHHLHPMLACSPRPCFEEETEIELLNLHKPGSGDAAGSFGLISLNNDDVDEGTLADWLLNGYSDYMEPGDFRAVPSTKFNGGKFRAALEKRMGTEMLFPIYRTLKGPGSTAEYEVIGWVAFVVTKVTGGGSSEKLHGYFTRVVWDALPATSPAALTYGVRAIELVE